MGRWVGWWRGMRTRIEPAEKIRARGFPYLSIDIDGSF